MSCTPCDSASLVAHTPTSSQTTDYKVTPAVNETLAMTVMLEELGMVDWGGKSQAIRQRPL